jgi:uncharacterized ferritin-like protein (DUF455 family)
MGKTVCVISISDWLAVHDEEKDHSSLLNESWFI